MTTPSEHHSATSSNLIRPEADQFGPARRALARTSNAPVVGTGFLTGGHLWALSKGPGRHASTEFTLVLAWPAGGQVVVGAGVTGVHEGRRFFTWRTEVDIESIELVDTDQATVATAELVFTDEHTQIFVAIVDDRSTDITEIVETGHTATRRSPAPAAGRLGSGNPQSRK